MGVGVALVVHFIDHSYRGGPRLVNIILLVRPGVITQAAPAAGRQTFQGVLHHAALYVLGQVGGIVFGHAFKHRFQNDSFRGIA